MLRGVRNYGLTLTLLTIFLLTIVSQGVAGWKVYNDEQRDHGQSTVNLAAYLRTGHFVEAVFENWESEFLQMGLYVLLTAYLFQRGSSESKDPDKRETVDENPRTAADLDEAPWPVRQGGFILILYEHSLSLALFLLFVLSFALHAAGGAASYNEEQLAHGGETVTALGYLATAQFWFESFQNWQSEFLSIAVIVVFSIFLRERGSPESKPVAAPHHATGSS